MSDQISRKIINFHQELRFWCKALCRLSIALYDPNDDTLSTFVSSNNDENPLTHYQALLSDVPSLKTIADTRVPRVIDDLRSLEKSPSIHTRTLLNAGVRSSYTIPMFGANDQLSGFLFFDATEAEYFTQELIHHLDVYAQLVAALVEAEIAPTKVLSAAVYTAKRFTSWRDEETGEHLARVSHYARLIAHTLAASHGIDDEFIEFLYQFAPLHDIGKISIPDNILLRQGPLDAAQRKVMDTHVTKGVEIVDELIESFSLHGITHVDILRNIVLYHHEHWDGAGYPHGLRGEDIPLEARIVGVADCFDALLSVRPYKQAWSMDETRAYILEKRGHQFDPACVDALLGNQKKIDDIRERFVDRAA